MSAPADETNAPTATMRPTVAPRTSTPEITALTGVRALVACWVVVVHFRDSIFGLLPGLKFLEPPVMIGFLGVEIFFVLSGFILAYNYADRMASGGVYRSFLWARVARIYPVQVVTVLAVVLLGFPAEPGLPKDTSLVNVVANFLMLQALPPFEGVDPPSWSLGCEAGAYLVFPVLAWWALRSSSRSALGWAAAIIALGVLTINLIVMAFGYPERWALSYPVMWLRLATCFTVGVLLWAWWRRRPAGSARWDLVALGCFLATVAASYFLDVASVSPVSFVVLPLLALFVLACALATGPLARLLSSRPMRWTGNLTYSLYMSHFILYLMFIKYVPWQDYADDPLVIRLAFLLVLALWITMAAAALYYLVEVPGRRILLSWWRRRQAGPAPAVTVPGAGS